MIACYDLARCPPTFDAVAFLALAELERQRRGDDYIDLFILPGPVGGFRRDNLWPQSVAERVQMRDRVLVPLCHLLPSVRSVEVLDHRGVEGWGKGENHIGLPNIVKALKAGCRPLRAPLPEQDTMRNPRLVTFTLREAEHHVLRNSRVDDWIAAAGALVKQGLNVCFVRDTVAPVYAIKGHVSAYYAPKNTCDRARLYRLAVLNVGISNGPVWMSIFMDAATLMLRPTTNEAGGCYDDWFFAKHGIKRGEQLPSSPSHQRLVWEEDRAENIVRAVEEMLEVVA